MSASFTSDLFSCLGDSLKEYSSAPIYSQTNRARSEGKLFIFERDLNNFIDSTIKKYFAILHLKWSQVADNFVMRKSHFTRCWDPAPRQKGGNYGFLYDCFKKKRDLLGGLVP
jgi:hypothetical protein